MKMSRARLAPHRMKLQSVWVLALVTGLCIPLPRVHADESSELDDAAARAQYAFYTADTRGLEEIASLIDSLDVPAALAPMKEYYAGYSQWKLAQLHAQAPAGGKSGSRSAASKAAAQACERHMQSALKLDARMAEAHAINAACSAYGSTLTSSNCSRSKSLRTAQELEPANPRVRLIDVLCLEGSEATSPAYVDKLRSVVASFEAQPPSRPGKPDWGQAEALVLLGQSHLLRGDSLAARDVIERALVIAPDYRKAQELLQVAAARPR